MGKANINSLFFFLLKQISCIYSCNKLYIRACQLYKRELEIEFQRIKCFLLLGMYMNLKADENNEKNVYRSDPSPPTHMLKKLKFFVHFLERLVTIYSRPSWDPNKKKIKTRKRRSVWRHRCTMLSEFINGNFTHQYCCFWPYLPYFLPVVSRKILELKRIVIHTYIWTERETRFEST